MGLAAPRRQQRHGRLVGVDHFVAEDEVLECLGQRRQAHPADADPLRHARARDVHARARVDLLLPVQRQVVVVFGDRYLREQARRGDALVDDLRGHRRGLDRLAARARRTWPADMAQHEELGRHAIELLAHLLADTLEGLAALAVGLLDLVVMIDARQARGQRLAHRLAFGPR